MIVQVFVLMSSLSMTTAFSNGVSIANGPQVTKSLYCGRESLRRMPIHLNVTKCQGYCHARTDVQDKFTISVSDNTYWGGTINVTIAAAATSDYIIKGFAVSAINDKGTVVGLFQESNDTTVAICHQGKKVEGNTIFHRNADPNRKSIKLQWQGPSQNYDDIKFRVWIVHSHDQIFYLESTPIHSLRNGSKLVNLPETLKKLLGRAAQFNDDRLLDVFENSFMDRQVLGYPDNLDDPFDPLKRLPRPHELIPPAHNGGKNVKQLQPRPPPTAASGRDSQDQNSLSGSSNLASEGQLVKTPEKPVKSSDSSGNSNGVVPAADSQNIPEASDVSKSGDVKMADKDPINIVNLTTVDTSGKDITAAVPSTGTVPLADTFTATPLLQNTTSDDVNIPTTTTTTTATTTTTTTTTTTMTITSTTAFPTNTTSTATISSKAVTGDDKVVMATTQSNDTAMSAMTTSPSIMVNNNTDTDATTTAVSTGQVPSQQPANVSGTVGLVSDMNSTQPLP